MKYTGGPAFPFSGDHAFSGMTLRDYFATRAMQATVHAWITEKDYPSTDFEVARNAYAIADAMLAARNQS